MKKILVVDDDRMILRLADEALKGKAPPYGVRTALNGREALTILDREPVDLVLTDLKMPVMDGFDLLKRMNGRLRSIPVIAMTGYGTPEIARQLRRKGVYDYVEKPFEVDVLRGKVSDALNNESKGFIHGFTLSNFLQAVQVEEKSITLRVTSRGRMGRLHLRRGDLIDADCRGLSGVEAVHEILRWDAPRIEMEGLQSRNPTIRTPLMRLLLEASRLTDEACRSAGEETGLPRAVFLAEAHHFRAAHKILTDLIRKTPRCADGWFWYSRILVKPESIASALENAARLAPKTPHVREERDRFARAKPALAEEAIRRCPFCWAPIPARLIRCDICNAHLSVQPSLFAYPAKADAAAMEGAIERYSRVIGRERNLTAYYYLSMAHLNAGHWEEALNLFHKMVNMAPERKAFAYQLRRLLSHMAAREPERRPPGKASAAPVAAVGSESHRKRVLVVEESPTTRKVIAITLSQQGYDVIEARDGMAALSKLSDHPPHLILLDVALPGMDGFAILEIIRKQDPLKDIPVILLTARAGAFSRWKARRAGAAACLTKPFDPTDLAETVEKHLRRGGERTWKR